MKAFHLFRFKPSIPRGITLAFLFVMGITSEAQTPEGTNLALRKPASGSTVYPNQTPDKALDGVFSEASKWTSASGIQPPHTLTVDLGNLRSVNGFIVRHAGAAGEMKGFNTQAFRIESAPFLSGPWVVHATVDNSGQDPVSTVPLPTPMNMRFIRLIVTDPGIDNYARIPEFEIYGPETITDHFSLGLNSNAPINAQSGNAGLNNDPNVMADTGSSWVRVNFILGPWLAPDDPTPHGAEGLTWFETYDRIIDSYLEQGVRIYGLIGLEAVRIPDGIGDHRAYLQTEEYTNLYVTNWIRILEHFRDRVRVVESINEPNDWAGGSSAIFPPSAFARLLGRQISSHRNSRFLNQLQSLIIQSCQEFAKRIFHPQGSATHPFGLKPTPTRKLE